MTEDVKFERYVDRLVMQAICCGQRDWNELVRGLPGVSPDVVFESLRRQELMQEVRFRVDGSDRRRGVAPLAYQFWRDGLLPTPHILDACWWFADSSLSILSSRVLKEGMSSAVLLGAPTLFHALLQDKRSAIQLTLIDRDSSIAKSQGSTSNQVFVDLLRDGLPQVFGDVVVADPPWYETELKSFLWAARIFCKKDGTVLLSVPPDGTRPGIAQEKSRLLAWAEGLGLVCTSHEAGILSYVSPPFEQNAFKGDGGMQPEEEWRRGDLATFSCVAQCEFERPQVPDETTWVDCSVGRVRFRVRPGKYDGGWADPSLVRILPNDLLPSVSRRSLVRESVDVWTSGNRVFRCMGGHVLILVLRALSGGRDIVEFVENSLGHSLSRSARSQLLNVAEELRDIVQEETHEYTAIQQRYEGLDIITN